MQLPQTKLVESRICPQLPQNFNFDAIAGDIRLPVEITTTYSLSVQEVGSLPAMFDDLCRRIVAAQQGISLLTTGPLALIHLLSSPNGQSALQKIGPWVKDQTERTANKARLCAPQIPRRQTVGTERCRRHTRSWSQGDWKLRNKS
jgi:hypothetical protein